MERFVWHVHHFLTSNTLDVLKSLMLEVSGL